MSFISLITTLMLLLVSVETRSLQQPFQVLGSVTNLGSVAANTLNNGPNAGPTPAILFEEFDTVLETNFTTGIGRSQAFRITDANTTGPNDQQSYGLTNISSILLNQEFYTKGSGISTGTAQSDSVVYPDQPYFGQGATRTTTNNNVIGLVGPNGLPQGTYSQNGFRSQAIRAGLGASQATGGSSSDSGSIDAGDGTIGASDSFGFTDAIGIGNNTIAEAIGSTFSVSGSEETVSGCQQQGRGYTQGIGSESDTAGAKTGCTSRSRFVTYQG
eukprot:TRINITY_DN303_c0_g1_i1.p2 TRINITY_DN303_c0_g1~~TRINITY_DN303_c0_g1_i1.p2  ORF type:complete len:272 (+),score=23.75 TRINITY_DN303_c0_g1_i1:79-894(+)